MKPAGGLCLIHTGILFLLAIALHTYYNWKSIMAYLNNVSPHDIYEAIRALQ